MNIVKILNNVLVAIIVASFFILLLWPYNLERTLKERFDFPENITVFQPTPSSSFLPEANINIPKEAIGELEGLLNTGKLALISNEKGQLYGPPIIYFSQGLIDMNLIKLKNGGFIDKPHNYLGQYGGPYKLDEKISNGKITGLVDISLKNILTTDVVILQSISNDLTKLPRRTRATFYYKGSDTSTIMKVHRLIEDVTLLEYSQYDISTIFLSNFYSRDLSQNKLEKWASIFLLIILLMYIFTQLSSVWHKKIEVFRIQRTLGRRIRFFYSKWMLESTVQWLPGLIISVLIILIKSRFDSILSLENLKYIVIYTIIICLVALIIASFLGITINKFSLARKNTAQNKTWANFTIPTAVAFLIVFSMAWLISITWYTWAVYSNKIRELGEDSILALTTSAAAKIPESILCKGIVGIKSCNSFSQVNASFSSSNFPYESILKSKTALNKRVTIGGIDPQFVHDLGIKLLKGKLPEKGSKEVVINDIDLKIINTEFPDFGIGTNLGRGYIIVGIVAAPKQVDSLDYPKIDVLHSHMFLSNDSPFFRNRSVLPPRGMSGLVIKVFDDTNIIMLKAEIRKKFNALEFIQPGSYERQVAKAVGKGLIRLIAIMIIALIFSILVFSNYINILISQKFLELSVWRMLGLTISKLKTNLLWEFVPIPLISGLLASLLASTILYQSGRPINLVLIAMGFGTATTFILIVFSYFIISYQVDKFKNKEINTLYRRSL